MNRVVHFEIHSSDPEKAARFYGELFGWEFTEWVIPGVQMRNEYRYWMVKTGGDGCGIDGGLVFRRGPAPTPGQDANSFVCTIDVASLDGMVARAYCRRSHRDSSEDAHTGSRLACLPH